MSHDLAIFFFPLSCSLFLIPLSFFLFPLSPGGSSGLLLSWKFDDFHFENKSAIFFYVEQSLILFVCSSTGFCPVFFYWDKSAFGGEKTHGRFIWGKTDSWRPFLVFHPLPISLETRRPIMKTVVVRAGDFWDRNFSFLFFLSPTFVGREVSIGSNIGISPPHHPPREGKKAYGPLGVLCSNIQDNPTWRKKIKKRSPLPLPPTSKSNTKKPIHLPLSSQRNRGVCACLGGPTQKAPKIYDFSHSPPQKKFLFTGNGQKKNKAKGVAGANSATKKVTLRAFFCSKTVSLLQ